MIDFRDLTRCSAAKGEATRLGCFTGRATLPWPGSYSTPVRAELCGLLRETASFLTAGSLAKAEATRLGRVTGVEYDPGHRNVARPALISAIVPVNIIELSDVPSPEVKDRPFVVLRRGKRCQDRS